MATNRDFTLRRNNGTDYDALLPTTHMGQVYYDNTLAKTLATHLAETYLPLSQKGVANGVATLDSLSKIPLAQLPDAVFDSLLFYNTFAATGNFATQNPLLADVMAGIASAATAAGRSPIGYYLVVRAAGSLFGMTGVAGTISGEYVTLDFEIGDGGATNPSDGANVEAGDWFVVTKFSGEGTSGSPYLVTVTIINNVYEIGSTTKEGIVKLSDATTTVGLSGNDVITEGILSGLIGSGAGKISAGDHTHTGFQPLDTDLTTIAALTPTDSNFIVGNGSAWTVESGATARASLGLTIGTHVQAYDATLAGIAAIAPLAAGNILYTTGTDTFGSSAITSFGRDILGGADAAAGRTTLGLVIGTNVQAYDQHLAAIVALAKTDGNIIVGNGTTWVAESGSTARTSLGLAIGSNVQAWDADLDTLAGLAKTDGNFIVGNGTTWVAESGATARTSLSVYSTSEVDTLLSNRPEIFYDTTTGAGSGDLIIDLD